jgi:hypothetical protein
MWTHKDIVEDVFSFTDLLDIHELLDVKEANQSAFAEYKSRMDALNT